jgi:hypothetical protein
VDVRGFALDEAVTLLQRQGYGVTTQEVRSKKGLEGNERRVVRVKLFEDKKEAALTYAQFKTAVE